MKAIYWVSSLLLVSPATADDWPQWRGPNRDGVWKEKGLISQFSTSEIPIKWRVEIGSGYSGPTVAKGRVYVTDRLRNPDRERIHCFDEITGATIWSKSYSCSYAAVKYPAGPRAAVTIHDELAYALGTTGLLHILKADTGEVIHTSDLKARFDIQMPIWGIAAAPLIVDSQLILQIGGKEACVVALDRKTGETRWTSLSDPASYSAPIYCERNGKPEIIVWTGTNVHGLNPTDGQSRWTVNMGYNRWVIGMATPVVGKDRLLVTSTDRGSLMIHLVDEPQTLWWKYGSGEDDTQSLHGFIGTPVMKNGHFYGVNKNGIFRCIDASNGKRIWEDRTATSQTRFSCMHIVRNGDCYWMFNDRGELIIATLSPQGYRELSRAKLIEPTHEQLRGRAGVSWSHPAFANRHIFARSDKELVCASLAAE